MSLSNKTHESDGKHRSFCPYPMGEHAMVLPNPSRIVTPASLPYPSSLHTEESSLHMNLPQHTCSHKDHPEVA